MSVFLITIFIIITAGMVAPLLPWYDHNTLKEEEDDDDYDWKNNFHG